MSRPPAKPSRLRGAAVRVPFFLYRKLLSPVLHAVGGSSGACRFQPSCSEYAALAIDQHGVVRGTLLALHRLAKCHPFHRPEFDPVPGLRGGTSAPASLQSCPPPITIEETGLQPIPAAGSRPLSATLPHDRR